MGSLKLPREKALALVWSWQYSGYVCKDYSNRCICFVNKANPVPFIKNKQPDQILLRN